MLKGFRDFILRGNVVELATAVIIGAAFTAIVTAISDKIINPLIAAIGSPDTAALSFQIRPENPATLVDFGAVITAVINFLIVAAVVYFVIILPMNKFNELRKRGQVEEEVPPTSEELLTEIRDLLARPAAPVQAGGPAAPFQAGGPAAPNGGGYPQAPGQDPRH